MARKTFISYKHSDAGNPGGTRDKIIQALGEDAKYYKGEDGYSDDLSDLKAETIKKKLSDMIFDTSVTIVILSPNICKSNWVRWEVDYSKKKTTRNGRQSQPNSIIFVIQKIHEHTDSETGYRWFVGDILKQSEIYRYLGYELFENTHNTPRYYTEENFLDNINSILNSTIQERVLNYLSAHRD